MWWTHVWYRILEYSLGRVWARKIWEFYGSSNSQNIIDEEGSLDMNSKNGRQKSLEEEALWDASSNFTVG